MSSRVTVERRDGSKRADVTGTKLWMDVISPSHPFFFRGLSQGLDGVSITTTVREKGETVSLARELGFDYSVVGRDFDHPLARMAGIPLRTGQLTLRAPDCDVSLSARNVMCVLASKANGIPSIHFTDNDITAHVDAPFSEDLYNWLRAKATYHVVPEAFRTDELTDWGASPESVYTYEGYKEDIYVADFEPDPTFTGGLPFEEYVVVRPEAFTAAYVDIGPEESVIPALLEGMVDRGLNVVYLPRRRGTGDEAFGDGYPRDRVFVPDRALNGLQLSWHARCVVTGSGTMAREAAAMGKPAVSVFPHTPLSVDQALIEEGRVFHSRDPDEVVSYTLDTTAADREPDLARARRNRERATGMLRSLIADITREEA